MGSDDDGSRDIHRVVQPLSVSASTQSQLDDLTPTKTNSLELSSLPSAGASSAENHPPRHSESPTTSTIAHRHCSTGLEPAISKRSSSCPRSDMTRVYSDKQLSTYHCASGPPHRTIDPTINSAGIGSVFRRTYLCPLLNIRRSVDTQSFATPVS